MRHIKYIGIFFSCVVLIVCLCSVAYAYCEHANPIIVRPSLGQGAALTAVKNAFNSYTSYFVTEDDQYELCFDFPEGEPLLEIPLDALVIVFAPSQPNKDIVLSGLKLKRTGSTSLPLLSIEYHNSSIAVKAIIEKIEISDATNGLKIFQTESDIGKSVISGNGIGTCIDLVTANDSIVKSSMVTGCTNGIRVYDSLDVLIGAVDAAHYDADKNIIANNGIGIYLEKGERVKFGYNANYGNDNISPSYENAIHIEAGMNGGVVPPVVIPYVNEDGSFTLECEKDSAGKITSRRIHFDNPPGTIQLYSADLNAGQAEQFIGDCEIAADGYCNCTILPDWVPVDEDKCGVSDGIEFAITAIFSNSNSSQLMEPKLFNGPYVVFAGPGIVQTTPSSEASGETYVEATPVSGGASGEGGGAEALAPSIASGCGGGGASLIPNDIMRTFAPSLGLWWIIFGVGIITGLRYRLARIRQRLRR